MVVVDFEFPLFQLSRGRRPFNGLLFLSLRPSENYMPLSGLLQYCTVPGVPQGTGMYCNYDRRVLCQYVLVLYSWKNKEVIKITVYVYDKCFNWLTHTLIRVYIYLNERNTVDFQTVSAHTVSQLKRGYSCIRRYIQMVVQTSNKSHYQS